MMLKLSRVFAVIKGLIAALTGRGGKFALLVDCHFEVDEDFQIVDLDTVRAAPPIGGKRCWDIVWTGGHCCARYCVPRHLCAGVWQGNTVVAELGEREHLWTFMAEMERPLDADDDLNFVVRDMNYFVSQGGIVDNSTLKKLRRPED
jgi:hypothetical protein